MILASIELSRRGYEYFNQYIVKLKELELYNFIKSKKDLPLFKGDPNKVRVQIKTGLVRRFFSNNSNIYIC